MKFTIERTTLLKQLQRVNGAISRNSAVPILQNVLMEANNDTLVITGSDLEIELVAQIGDVDLFETGRTTVPAKKLLDIVKSLPDDDRLTIMVEQDKMTLTQGKRKYTFQCLNASDYPNVNITDVNEQVTISNTSLASLINATAFSMANQDVRYYLNGLMMELEGDCIVTVATDGHRLAKSHITLPGSTLGARQVIIPRKCVAEINKLISGAEQDVVLVFNQNHLKLTMGDLVITTKLIDGKFPDYKRVIPKAHPTKVTVSRDDLKGACVRASILANEKFKGVRFTFGRNTVRLYATNPEHEAAEEVIDIESNLDKEQLDIAFNVDYVLDVLNNIKDPFITFSLADERSGALCQGTADINAFYVLMPTRL